MTATIHPLPVNPPQDEASILAAISRATAFRTLGAVAKASGRELTPAALDDLWARAASCSLLPAS